MQLQSGTETRVAVLAGESVSWPRNAGEADAVIFFLLRHEVQFSIDLLCFS